MEDSLKMLASEVEGFMIKVAGRAPDHSFAMRSMLPLMSASENTTTLVLIARERRKFTARIAVFDES